MNIYSSDFKVLITYKSGYSEITRIAMGDYADALESLTAEGRIVSMEIL